MSKLKLDVIGEQFILNSQIDTITAQTAKLYEIKNDYENRQKAWKEKKKRLDICTQTNSGTNLIFGFTHTYSDFKQVM